MLLLCGLGTGNRSAAARTRTLQNSRGCFPSLSQSRKVKSVRLGRRRAFPSQVPTSSGSLWRWVQKKGTANSTPRGEKRKKGCDSQECSLRKPGSVTHQLYPGSDALPTHPHREGLFPVNNVVAQIMIVEFAKFISKSTGLTEVKLAMRGSENQP